MTTLALADDIGKSPSRSEPRFNAHLPGFLFHSRVLHFHVREPPLLFSRRNKCHKRRILFITCLEVIGNEVANCGTSTLKFRIIGEVNYEHIKFFLVRRCVRAESLVSLNVALEGIFNILIGPVLRLGLVQMIQHVNSEIVEASLIEGLGEGLADEIDCLLFVHVDLQIGDPVH